MEEDARLVEETGTMNTERRTDTEKVSNTLAAGIKATGGQGEERGEEKGEERGLPSDPGGARALGPPLGGEALVSLDRGGGAKAGGKMSGPGLVAELREEASKCNSVYSWVHSAPDPELLYAAANELERSELAAAERDTLRAEADALKADLARAESFAASHEAWEACMVSHNPAWEPGGRAEFPRLVQPLWDAALGLQGRRNRVLEGARQAGRVGSAGDLGHAWEAVRGLAGLDPDPKADPTSTGEHHE
jgi:hypothetical protein